MVIVTSPICGTTPPVGEVIVMVGPALGGVVVVVGADVVVVATGPDVHDNVNNSAAISGRTNAHLRLNLKPAFMVPLLCSGFKQILLFFYGFLNFLCQFRRYGLDVMRFFGMHRQQLHQLFLAFVLEFETAFHSDVLAFN
jgi:hypothetical protein